MRRPQLSNLATRPPSSGFHQLSISRVLWVCLLAPMLVLGGFGGVSFFAHAHDGHGLHFHAAKTEVRASQLAANHVNHHQAHAQDSRAHDHDCVLGEASSSCEHQSSSSVPQRSPAGVLVTLPDCDQVRVQAVEAPQFPTLVGELVEFGESLAAILISMEPGESAVASFGPKHLCCLGSCARIVRTSSALLI